VSKLTGHEEWESTEQEAKVFMERAQNVARHYSVATTQKTLDWIAFMGCVGAFYVPRVYVISHKKRAARAARAAATEAGGFDPNQTSLFDSSVTPFRPH
jgi:hypothetical protein